MSCRVKEHGKTDKEHFETNKADNEAKTLIPGRHRRPYPHTETYCDTANAIKHGADKHICRVFHWLKPFGIYGSRYPLRGAPGCDRRFHRRGRSDTSLVRHSRRARGDACLVRLVA